MEYLIQSIVHSKIAKIACKNKPVAQAKKFGSGKFGINFEPVQWFYNFQDLKCPDPVKHSLFYGWKP